jgi:hypothetical protein
MAEYNYKGLSNEVVSRGISLAESFEDWTKLAFALSDLGEDGRQMFHAISSLSSKYRQAENDRKFTNAMNTASKVGISTFIYMCQQAGIDTHKYYLSDYNTPNNKVIKPLPRSQQKPKETPSYISKDIAEKCLSADNNLIYYLCGYFDTDTLKKACALYFMSSARNGSTIYWQVDEQMKVRSGKVIMYDGDTGHRVKDTGVKWVHKIMNLQDFNLVQCLYGEHLLKLYPDKPVCLVEGEKTAFICSMIYPQYNWLSCGGLGNFKAERLQAIKDRNVVVFPDTDTTGETFAKWKDTAKAMGFTKLSISDFCEKNSTQEQKKMKCDIADILLADMKPIASDVSAQDEQGAQQCQKPMTDAERTLERMMGINPHIRTLTEKLNLKIVA